MSVLSLEDALPRIFADDETLKELHVAHDANDVKGLKALADALKQNTTLI